MPRDRDLDNAASSGQSKRPSLVHRDSDTQSDTTNPAGLSSHNPRTKPLRGQHHVGRLHGRVPSTKAVHKVFSQAHGSTAKLNHHRRSPSLPTSPNDVNEPSQRPPNHRASTEVKLPRQTSVGNLPKSLSHTNLKRNRSHVEITKRTRSSDKLKRTSSGTGIHRTAKSNKIQVHFDLGSDDPEDEWVDASGTNSPYLSRKGSVNSSAQSSVRQGASAENSRPTSSALPPEKGHRSSSPDRLTAQHKEYLTSRLLQRTPSHVAPTQMTDDIARAAPAAPARSFSSVDHAALSGPGSNQDEVVSRFVDGPSSGLTNQDSFYRLSSQTTGQKLDALPARSNSMADLEQSRSNKELVAVAPSNVDISALVPDPARRNAAPTAETSRTQQKLNLQRASSVLEPGQGLSGAGGVIGLTPLMGVGGSGLDGGSSRADPRIGRLLERTGMEYLVVRRYQNPIARSLNRLSRLPGMDKPRRIPRAGTGGLPNGKRTATATATDPDARHARNSALPDSRHPARNGAGGVTDNGASSSFDGEDAARLSERLSGVSLVGAEEEGGTHALLRNLWDKPMDLSAGAD